MLRGFLKARGIGPGPSALVRMPTGTGKSGVIAVTARRLVRRGDVLLLSPWDALVDQLTRDVKERFWHHIGVKPPGAKDVIRLYPSTVSEKLAKEHRPVIWTATIATLQRLHSARDPSYAEIARRLALVIVDEGHYEPAPSWAKAVRELECPSALFTATPYRNDFKAFQLDKNFYYVYSHNEAEQDRYIRDVRFETHEFSDEPSFCEKLVDAWRRLSSRTPEARVIVRCATENSVRRVTQCLDRLGVSAIGIHERFEAADGPQFRRDVPDPEEEFATFWVHQNKLIEGIDEAAFRMVAFFEPFSSERAFVQQVGRVLRNPERQASQHALIFCDPRRRLEDSWSAFRSYDLRTDFQSLSESPRDFAWRQPPSHYFDRRFREPLDVSSPGVHEDFDYPRSTRVYVVPENYHLNKLAKAIQREWEEYDFVAPSVISPYPFTRLHPYIAIRNSRLLLRKTYFEYEIGLTIYRRIRNYLFFYDSQGKVPRPLTSEHRVDDQALTRLYAGATARLNSVSLLNTNLSRQSSRRRVVDAYSIAELAPDLADHSHYASAVSGQTQAPDWAAVPTLKRYVGFTHGRVSDRVGETTPFADYMRWLDYIADALDDQHVEPLPVFDRFAEVIGTPDDPTPTNILLDFDQELFDYTSKGVTKALDIQDLCMEVSNGVFVCDANRDSHEVTVRWDAALRRYSLESSTLDRSVSMKNALGNRRAQTLLPYLNREQAFRIVPASIAKNHCVYVGGRFCRARRPLWGSARSSRFDLLQILEPIPELATIKDEKERSVKERGEKEKEAPVPSGGWESGTLFSLVDTLGSGTAMAPAFDGVNFLVCDDMGTEIADFIALSESRRRAIAIHAKAFRIPKPLSASALHEVSSQAVKNLAYFQPYFVGEPKNLDRWDGPWRGSRREVSWRIRRGGRITARGAWNKIRTALLDPQTVREVWLVLGQGLSRTKLDAERQKQKPAPEVIQMLYLLQAIWSSVSSLGCRLRVFCSP